ncbi:MAG: hypothetical protein ACRDIY_06390 [Chloroflexota bacterium]
MQITTNNSFASRRALIGRWSTILGFGVLIVGMYVSLQQPQRPTGNSIELLLFAPWITLFLGIILLNIGKYHSTRWGTNPRVDRALARGLKGLNDRYHLFNFISELPAEHVLVTPQGVIVLEPRPFIGEVLHEGDRWRRPINVQGLIQRFADGGIGNPTKEALKSAAAIQSTLRERLGDELGGSIMVLPIIVMTNDRVKLQMSDPEVPVIKLVDIRGGIRQLKEGHKLTADVHRQLVRALQPDSSDHALSTTRSNT